MAFYIDFNFINIRDLIDLSEVDSEFENQLQSFVAEIFESSSESSPGEVEESAIKFLSGIVAENDMKLSEKNHNKDITDIIMNLPVTAAIPETKQAVDKNEAYIKYINSKFEQSQAEYFINVLLNPVQTNLRNRFDYVDVRNSYLQTKILGKDKESAERTDDNRRQDEKLRNVENERRNETLRKSELDRFFEFKNKEQYKRV